MQHGECPCTYDVWRCRGWADVGMWTLCDRLRGPSWNLDQTEGEMDEQTEGEMD